MYSAQIKWKNLTFTYFRTLSFVHFDLMWKILDVITWWFIEIIFLNYRSKNENIVIYPADVVIVEGILSFYFPAIRDLFHMKLFVDTDSDTRLARRGKYFIYF